MVFYLRMLFESYDGMERDYDSCGWRVKEGVGCS